MAINNPRPRAAPSGLGGLWTINPCLLWFIYNIYFACAISYFDFSLPADGKCKSFFAIAPGYVITAVFVIGLALLGQTSFEIDTVQLNG